MEWQWIRAHTYKQNTYKILYKKIIIHSLKKKRSWILTFTVQHTHAPAYWYETASAHNSFSFFSWPHHIPCDCLCLLFLKGVSVSLTMNAGTTHLLVLITTVSPPSLLLPFRMLPLQLYSVTKRARVWCQASGRKWQLVSQVKKRKRTSDFEKGLCPFKR